MAATKMPALRARVSFYRPTVASYLTVQGSGSSNQQTICAWLSLHIAPRSI